MLYSPMEQFNIYSLNVFLTNWNLYILIITLLIISFINLKTNEILPNYWNLFTESMYRTIS